MSAAELTPDTLVTYQHTQIKLSVAENLGLVRRDTAGNYTTLKQPGQDGEAGNDSTDHPTDDAPIEAPAVSEGHEGNLGEEAEGIVQQIVEGDAELVGDLYNSTVEAIVAGADTSEGLGIDHGRVAEALGFDNTLGANGAINKVVEAYGEQAARVLTEVGMTDLDGFLAFAQGNPQQYRDALRRQLDGADLSG